MSIDKSQSEGNEPILGRGVDDGLEQAILGIDKTHE